MLEKSLFKGPMAPCSAYLQVIMSVEEYYFSFSDLSIVIHLKDTTEELSHSHSESSQTLCHFVARYV